MDLQNEPNRGHQFLVYVSFILLMLQRVFFSFYELTPLIETILLLGLAFITLRDRKTIESLTFRLVFLIIVVTFIIYVIRNAHTGIGSIQTLLLFLFYYLLAEQSVFNEKDMTRFQTLSIITMIVLYVADLSQYNTNSVGLSYLIMGVYSTLFLSFRYKKDFILFISISIFTLFCIYQSDSRTAVLSYGCYIVFRLIPTVFYTNKICLLSILVIFTIGSLLYIYVYIDLYMNDYDLPLVSEFSDKKLFSGRQLIWIETLKYFSEYPITGIGSKIHLSSHSNVNLHNSMLMFFAIYGSLVGGLVMILIYKVILPLSKWTNNHIVKNSLAAYLTFLLVGFSETNIISISFACIFPIYIAYSVKNNNIYN